MEAHLIDFTGTKRLVGRKDDTTARAERITLEGEGSGWLIVEAGRPTGVEPSWDQAQSRLRSLGYRVRIEDVERRQR
jgi:hypothetical protein